MYRIKKYDIYRTSRVVTRNKLIYSMLQWYIVWKIWSHIKSGHSQDFVLVVDAVLLHNLRRDGDGRVDRVRDDGDDGVRAELGHSLKHKRGNMVRWREWETHYAQRQFLNRYRSRRVDRVGDDGDDGIGAELGHSIKQREETMWKVLCSY